MRLFYISGAFTASTSKKVKENIKVARDIAEKYWALGAVICPHLNCPQGFEKTIGYDRLLEGDLEMVRRVDVVVMCPNWDKSHGATLEHDEARKEGKAIIYEEVVQKLKK